MSVSVDDSALLVADIGGTNARFALAHTGTGAIELQQIRELHTADFASLADALRHYLQAGDLPTPARAVLAVAAPVSGEQVRITNNPWHFSVSGLRRETGIAQLRLINDFAAVAYAVSRLPAEHLQHLGGPLLHSAAGREGRYAVLGPGTGLGVAHLLIRQGEAVVIETEGGHVGFAPSSAEEREVLRLLLQEFPRVSWERLLSGPGLLNLYRALAQLRGETASLLQPAQITQAASEGRDTLALHAVQTFCALLGSFSGDVVLGSGAWDGLFLAGGVTPRLLPWLQEDRFRSHFEAKGRFSDLLARVPSLLVNHPHTGLYGAAAAA